MVLEGIPRRDEDGQNGELRPHLRLPEEVSGGGNRGVIRRQGWALQPRAPTFTG
jgi:hypothetical protein